LPSGDPALSGLRAAGPGDAHPAISATSSVTGGLTVPGLARSSAPSEFFEGGAATRGRADDDAIGGFGDGLGVVGVLDAKTNGNGAGRYAA